MNNGGIRSQTTFEQKGTLELELKDKPIEEQVKLSILKDLLNLNWNIQFNDGKVEVFPHPHIMISKLSNNLWVSKGMRSLVIIGIGLINTSVMPVRILQMVLPYSQSENPADY